MKIAIIGYKEFADITRNFIRPVEKTEIKIFSAFLDECIPLLSELKHDGFEAILTGEANASLIKDITDIPVLTFKVTYSDILNAINSAIIYGNKIGVAIASFENQIFNWEPFEKLLGIKIFEISYSDIGQLLTKVAQAKEQNGICTIIGTSVAVSVANEIGLPGFMIYSIQDTVQDAINRAIELIVATRKEQARSRQFETIIDSITDGVIAIDKQNFVTICNRSALKILGLPKDQVINKPVTSIDNINQLSNIINLGVTQLDQIQQIGTSQIVINRIPIKVKHEILGAVATFHDVTRIQDLEKKIEGVLRAKGLNAKASFSDIIGSSTLIQKTINNAKKYASGHATILIIGETGSGKEIFAQSIHNYSPRKDGPFVAVNCGALPENLLESELFGYEEGAFTGTKKSGKKGLFELAHHGTIFLDEINSTSLSFQNRLLRVLQEREIMRLGSDRIIPIDVRIIAATNEDLLQSVIRKEFRSDLYYRLNVLKLYIPALRDRPEDIIPLFKHFLNNFSPSLGRKFASYPSELLAPLSDYDFPGNIRELMGIVERLITLFDQEASTDLNYVSNLLVECLDRNIPTGKSKDRIYLELQPDLKETLKEAERQVLLHYLKNFAGDKTCLAKELGIGRTTLYRKFRILGLE